jgi:hypothetical protein
MAELAPHLTTPQAFLIALRRQNVRLPLSIDPTEPAGLVDADGNDVLVVDVNRVRSDAEAAEIAALVMLAVNHCAGFVYRVEERVAEACA